MAATQPPQEMGNVFIFGLRPQFDLPALVDVAKGFDGWKIFTPFTDVARHCGLAFNLAGIETRVLACVYVRTCVCACVHAFMYFPGSH